MNKEQNNVLVAGIGASAGGLEALKQLLPTLPDYENIVYIIVQHMDPKHDSLLRSLLSSSTGMKVNEIQNNDKLAPNEIFITPPGFDLTLEADGSLVLHKCVNTVGPKPSVDRFLESLANNYRERAVGIILSGTGSDGARGMRAIKAHGGITIVQKSESAKYDGMPRAAIDTGSVDLILEAPAIGSELQSFIHSPLLAKENHIGKPAADDMDSLMTLLKTHLGYDFSEYKENTLQRRINRRLALHKLSDLYEYVQFARKNPADLDGLVKDILISVTEFFRDKKAFKELRKCVEQIVDSKTNSESIRVWVPGCSSGEEVYSIAFLFTQILEEKGKSCNLQFYATDIDGDIVKLARKGIYPEASLDNIDQTIKSKFLRVDGEEFQIIKSIREYIVFAKQNIITDPPFSHLDLITCRNLLIYFNSNLQERIIAMFHYALNPGGILFLGKSESIGQHKDLFSPIDSKWRIFKRKDTGKTYPATFRKNHYLYNGIDKKEGTTKRKKEISPKEIIDQAISYAFGPPSVLVNEQMQLVYAKGNCQNYFEISEGTIGLSIFDLIKSELRAVLRTTIGKAVREKSTTISRKNRLSSSENGFSYIDIHAYSSNETNIPDGFVLVSFIEQKATQSDHNELESPADYNAQRLIELEHELAAAHERLQTTVEELETSNEELQSLNEELQSSNEELQSTNEELETSNEELQATNEELATVNQEMQVRSAELSEANADLENVFKRMGVPLLVLDMECKIRRHTPAVDQLFTIMPGDKGQLITNLETNLELSAFRKILENVLQTGTPYREKMQSLNSKFYEMRIYPYYDDKDIVNGLLLTFYDITLANQREQEFRALAENAPDIVARFDRKFRHLFINKTIERYADVARDDYVGKSNRELGMPEELCSFWETELDEVFTSGKQKNIEFDFQSPEGVKWFESRIVPEYSPGGEAISALAISRDITNLKQAQIEYEDTIKSISDGFFVLDDSLEVQYFNDAAGKLLNKNPTDIIGKPLFTSFPEAKGSIFEEKYRLALQKKEKVSFETYFDEAPYGNWYNVSVYPKTVGISVYFQVTTEQKNKQLEVHRQKELFSAILDNIPVLIVLYDTEVNTLHINKAFEEKTGWSKDEIDADNIMEKCYPDPEYRAKAAAYMTEASTKWQEFSLQTKAGSFLDTIWSNVQMQDGTQIGIGIDISDKKELEELLYRKAKLESLGRLAGGIAHDFNNSLAVILGFTELAEMSTLKGENCQHELQQVLKSANKARDMVKQILTFTQKIPTPKKPTVINDVVNDIVDMLRPTIPSYIKIESECAKDNIVIMADPNQIHQVIVNLCNNAVDAMMENEGLLKISVNIVETEKSKNAKIREMSVPSLVKLDIADTGTGIDKDHLDKIFDPYFSTKSKGPKRGSGLGLAIVHGIIREHKGEITVESTSEKGTVFTILIPLLENTEPVKQLDQGNESIDNNKLKPKNGHLLIIDDDPAIVHLQKRRLSKLGYKVSDFTDCYEALSSFKNNRQDFDLVITDMTMPQMTGDRFAKAIKAIDPEMQVILCTGHSDKVIPEKLSEMCIDALLMKPFSLQELVSTMHKVLNAEG